MLGAAEPSSSTALAVALIGVFGVTLAALITGVLMWHANRRLGKPNGTGNINQQLTTVIQEVGEIRGELRAIHAEAGTTRGMVEAAMSEFRDHQREDRDNFAYLFAQSEDKR